MNRLFLMFVVLHAWSGGLAAGDSGGRIELPARVSLPRTTVPEPPALPAAASALSPMTFELVSTSQTPEGPRAKTIQTVLRTADRVLLVPEVGGSEWLFQRNPVDSRRVSGYLVDHARRQVLVHHDSDLRNRMRLHGWADVLTMRFDPQSLAALHATGERETAGGETFDHYVARDQSAQGVSDVWWSDTLLLPLRLTVRAADAATTWTIERFEPGVDAERLDDPRKRFPQYTVLDISDSLERGH